MPIRFRCGHCNQLMGISHKKAGAVVRCPTCTSEVTVPEPNAKVSERAKRERQPDVFERSDFDEIFQVLGRPQRPGSLQAAPASSAPAAPPLASLPEPAQPELKQVDRPVTFQPTGSGSSGQSGSQPTAWSRWRLIAVVALALVFGAGLLAGMFIERSFHQPSPEPTPDAPGSR